MMVLTATTAWAQDVSYLEYNTTTKTFDSKTCSSYTTVTDQTAWTAGWYVVSSDVTIETRISVTGDVHLILANGATLSAPKGIGCIEGNSLTIYGQSNDEATMGVLNAGQGVGANESPDYGYAAIGGEGTSTSPVNGTITIHGGKICPKAHAYAAAIGGGYGNQNNKKDFGTIVINGGIINADGTDIQCPAVIGGGTYMKRGDITINGGTITITVKGNSQGALIGAGVEAPCGHITINGGEITAVQPTGAVAAMGPCIGGGCFMTMADNMTDPDLDQIVITGGTITATATYGGAAIGGGMKGKCGTISISGGTINASATYSAAIGNGNGIKVDGGNIIITGGVINATSGRAAIGASQAGYGPAISFSWTDEDNDRITATTTHASIKGIDGSSVTVANGKAFVANGVSYSGTLTTDELTALGGNTLVPAVTADITLATEGYGTYYDSERKILLPAGMKASIVTGEDNGTVDYDIIANGDGDGETVKKTVPAGVAVMLYSKGGGNKTITLCKGISDSRTFTTNMLGGSDTEQLISAESGKIYYKLTYSNNNDNFGWYWGTADGAAFTSPAHKAWLALDAGTGEGGGEYAPSFFALPSETTSISDITHLNNMVEMVTDQWYSLGGQRLSGKPTTKGLYINNGKKVIIK